MSDGIANGHDFQGQLDSLSRRLDDVDSAATHAVVGVNRLEGRVISSLADQTHEIRALSSELNGLRLAVNQALEGWARGQLDGRRGEDAKDARLKKIEADVMAIRTEEGALLAAVTSHNAAVIELGQRVDELGARVDKGFEAIVKLLKPKARR